MNAALPVLLALALGASTPALGVESGPQVTAGGTGEIHIPATRATFEVTIEVTAETSAAASGDNARASKTVTAALVAAGLQRDELKASRITVNGVWETPKGAERRRRGYLARNTLQIETKQLDRIGAFIDAALEAGASATSNPNFNSDDRIAARHQALALAVAAARDDAEVIAKAAGGSLGELESIGTDGAVYSGSGPMAMVQSRAAGAATEIIASDITVVAHVNARWVFVPLHR